MQVHCDEGVAIHIGPESCVRRREAVREALTGERTGQPLSRERALPRMPTPSLCRKATRTGAPAASARPIRRGRRTWHVRTLLVDGNREISASTARAQPAGPHREGEEP